MSTNNSVNSSLSGTTGSGNFVGSTSPSITTPKIVSQVLDTNGNPIIGLGVTSSAVNYLTITNQSTGTPPFLSASGNDTNISINLAPKGTGLINLLTAATTNPLTIVSGTSSQHVTTFNFFDTSASRAVTFPDLTGTVALSGASQSVTFNDLTLTSPLPVSSGGTGLSSLPSTFYVNTASTSINSIAIVKYSNIVNDSASGYSASTGLYTIPTTGWYTVNANIKTTSYNFGSSAIIQIDIRQNSTVIAQQIITPTAYNSTSLSLNAGTVYKFTAGDTVSVYGFSNLGGSSTTLDGSVTNFLSINFLHS